LAHDGDKTAELARYQSVQKHILAALIISKLTVSITKLIT